MKNFIICLLFTVLFITNRAHGQNMAVNTDGSLPDASAMVDIKSTSKGLLAPRMTTTQQNAIASPANGLLIYNTTDNLFRVNTGTPGTPIWTALNAATNNWLLTGNSGSNSATDFLGTTDDKKMILKSNGQSFLEFGRRQTLGLTQSSFPDYADNDEKVTYVRSALQFEAPNASFYKPKMFTDANGNFRVKGSSAGTDFFEFGSTGTNNNGGFEFIIGDDGDEPILFKSYNYLSGMSEIMRLQSGRMAVGSNSFNASNPEKLLIDAGVTNSYNLMTGKGSINNYLQINVQNQSNGANASSDLVATSNNGDETTNYVDMGINGGSYTGGFMGTANDGYLYTMGNNFLLGAGNSGKSLMFLTGGTDSATNERMRIDGNGNVGIGVANPTNKLQVNAASNPLKLVGLQTGSNADSVLTVSNGVVRRLNVSALGTSSTAWSLVCNAATNPATNFIGTTDAQALIVKENNTQVARFNDNSIALGNAATTSNSPNSYSLGSAATVGFNKTAAMALGNSATISADSSFALGTAAVVNGTNSFAIGSGASANNTNSLAIGRNATTAYSITDAVAVGTYATANASNSIAIGSNFNSSAKTITNAASAIAIGNAASSNSTNAVVIGTGASTGYNLTNPIAVGVNSLVNGNNGIAIGNGANISSVSNATVIGAGASATSTATNSTAIGYNTAVTKTNEIVLGDMTNTALSVGIGTEGFSTSNREKLLVDAGTTTSVNAIVGKGTIDSYLQLNIQNNSAGTSASSDVVATANNGTETNNYVDMGINGGNYSGGSMGGANDSYLYNTGQNFLIGSGSVAKSLIFMTGGTSQATNERMRIDGNGNVGIGNIAPTQKLDVTGNLRFSGALMPNNIAGTLGYMLQSNGAGTAPTWIDPSAYLSSLSWLQNGNSVPSIKSFGTTSNYDLPFITNNTEKMRIAANGDVAIGTTAFNATNPEQLLVDAGTTTSVNAIVGKGSVNSYLQLNIQNNSAGTSASSDVVATANNGNETSNYVDMGINGGSYTGGVMGAANDGYLYTMGNNFLLGTGNASKALVFMTGGTTQSTNERMRIDGNGKVGIGTVAPLAYLDVNNNGSATTPALKLGKPFAGNSNTDSLLTWNPADSTVRKITPSSILNSVTLPLMLANGTVSSTTSLRDYNAWVSQKTYGGNFVTDVAGSIANPIPNEAAWFALSNVGTYPNSAGANVNYFGQTSLNDHNFYFRGGTVNTSTGVITSTGWLKNLSIPASSLTNISIDASLNATFNVADNAAFKIATNNVERMVVDKVGNVGIGTSTFNATSPEKLIVDAGTTTSVNAIVGKGSINSYLQLNIQNQSGGTAASSDVVATANNGDETTNYVDMGINGGSYTGGVMGAANDGYLYTMGNNFLLGTGNASKSLVFMTGGTTQATNERMRIDGSGNVGIGTNAPAQKFHVNGGNVRISNGGINADIQVGTSFAGVTNAAGIIYYEAPGNETHMFGGEIIPDADNSRGCGSSARRWSAVYAANGTIQTSDFRMKKNIHDMPYGLKEVMLLKPVSYNWKDNTGGNKIGLIAQEVRKVIPEVVVGDESKENLGMNYAEMVPVLINAIKEQQQQIDTLKKEVLALKNK